MNTNMPLLNDANRRRQREGAARQVAAVTAALARLGGRAHRPLAEAAGLRLKFPDESLDQLARRLGVTKDAFAVVAGAAEPDQEAEAQP